jgi:hypothetical protein
MSTSFDRSMCIAKQVQHRSIATSRGFVESIPRCTISLQHRYRKKDVKRQTRVSTAPSTFNLQPTCKLHRANITAGPLHEELDRIQLAFATLGRGESGMRIDCTYRLQECNVHAQEAAVLHLRSPALGKIHQLTIMKWRFANL